MTRSRKPATRPDRRPVRPASALLLGALAAACGTAPVAAPSAGAPAPPARLADTGLFADFAARAPAPGVLPFSPQYPLWSDGAAKRRWVWLPPGTWIDASDPDAWVFPVGTKLWKEFAFERPVETRYLERLADGTWLRATYLWSADGSDAPLAPEDGVRGAWPLAGGRSFDVPARTDCGACHDAGPNAVLGFTALQLSPDRDPLAPHAEEPPPGAVDLAALVERGLVRRLPADLAERAPRIDAPPRERAVLGYLHGNCGHCHTARGALGDLGLALDYPLGRADGTAPARASALDRPSRWLPPGVRDARRIEPGDPERSVLGVRMRSRNALLQMPPLGTNVCDEEALALIEAWIREECVDPLRPETSLASHRP